MACCLPKQQRGRTWGYKPEGERFSAIEPWHGFASPFDFDGEFSEKPDAGRENPNRAVSFIRAEQYQAVLIRAGARHCAGWWPRRTGFTIEKSAV